MSPIWGHSLPGSKNLVNSVSTVECERGFIQKNLTITSIQNNINIQRVLNLLSVKQDGPPLKDFKTEEYSKI